MQLRYSILILLSAMLLIQCKQSTSQDNLTGSKILKAYVVQTANETQSRGKLKYMEIEDYENGVLISKTYYDGNQNVRGTEKYEERNDLGQALTSVYYTKEGSIQSTYKNKYENGKKMFAYAYEGNDITPENLLRIEKFGYDENGNRTSKIVMDKNNNIQRAFLFAFDTDGNEVKMKLKDGNNQILLNEDYEITAKDKKNHWSEKYGYINDSKYPSVYYQQTTSLK